MSTPGMAPGTHEGQSREVRLTTSPAWVSSPPMPGGVTVGFWGVRGSTPCEGPRYQRYGGHSSCVVVESEGQSPIVFDLGTGLRSYGEQIDGDFHGSVLLTHLHWDHVQGL